MKMIMLDDNYFNNPFLSLIIFDQFHRYRIIPNRSTGCLDMSPGGGYIRFK